MPRGRLRFKLGPQTRRSEARRFEYFPLTQPSLSSRINVTISEAVVLRKRRGREKKVCAAAFFAPRETAGRIFRLHTTTWIFRLYILGRESTEWIVAWIQPVQRRDLPTNSRDPFRIPKQSRKDDSGQQPRPNVPLSYLCQNQQVKRRNSQCVVERVNRRPLDVPERWVGATGHERSGGVEGCKLS